jgi:hypothetical protein
LYRLRFHRLIAIRFLPSDDKPSLEAKIFYWKKNIELPSLAIENKKTETQPEPVKTQKTGKRSFSVSPQKIVGVLKSFKVNKCAIHIDTGNYQLNAWLYPIIYFIQIRTKRTIQINFTGNNELILEIKNSLARMSWAYIRNGICGRRRDGYVTHRFPCNQRE